MDTKNPPPSDREVIRVALQGVVDWTDQRFGPFPLPLRTLCRVALERMQPTLKPAVVEAEHQHSIFQTPKSDVPSTSHDAMEAWAIIEGFLKCPEIADCAPEDMDGETHVLESRARRFLSTDPTRPKSEMLVLANALRKFAPDLADELCRRWEGKEPTRILATPGYKLMARTDIPDMLEVVHLVYQGKTFHDHPGVTMQPKRQRPPMERIHEAVLELAAVKAFDGVAVVSTGVAHGPRAVIVGDILAERQRQISEKGYDSAHDDKHAPGELATAAAAYALRTLLPDSAESVYPWMTEGFAGVPTAPPEGDANYISNLVTASALLLAEIERVVRKSKAAQP